MFENMGKIILGNDYCHLLIDLDVHNVTKEVAELIYASERVISKVKADEPRPYLAGHLNLLHSAKDGLQEAFEGLALVLTAHLPDVYDFTAEEHLLHHQPNLLVTDHKKIVTKLEEKFNVTLDGDQDNDSRNPRQAGLLSGIVALGTSLFNIFDLSHMTHRVNNLDDKQQHIGMLLKRQDLLTTKSLNISLTNRKLIKAMIEKELEFNYDNNQMSAIHLLASTCLVLTRTIDQLTTGIQTAQEGRMSPHLINQKVLGEIYHRLSKRIKTGHYYLVQDDALGLLRSPVTLVGQPQFQQGSTLPKVQLLIHVPVARNQPYRLLRYVDAPIHSQPPNTFISYQTKPYLALEGNNKNFAELDQTELDQCSLMGKAKLCPTIKVVKSDVKTCLMALYTNDNHEKACPTKVEHGTFSLRRLKNGLYNFNTLENIILNYHFVNQDRNIREITYKPGVYQLQLNDSIQHVSSPYFTIQGVMKPTIQLEEHLTFKTLHVDVENFSKAKGHTHSHPLPTQLDLDLPTSEIPDMNDPHSVLIQMANPLAISRAIIVTIVVLTILGSAFCLARRCCRPCPQHRWRRRTYRICGQNTSSGPSTEVRASPLHASAPAIMDETIQMNVYPTLPNQQLQDHRQALLRSQQSRASRPSLNAELPNPVESSTNTIVPESPPQ